MYTSPENQDDSIIRTLSNQDTSILKTQGKYGDAIDREECSARDLNHTRRIGIEIHCIYITALTDDCHVHVCCALLSFAVSGNTLI